MTDIAVFGALLAVIWPLSNNRFTLAVVLLVTLRV